jgi:hypothetical protein
MIMHLGLHVLSKLWNDLAVQGESHLYLEGWTGTLASNESSDLS